jgi:hypothetical protein
MLSASFNTQLQASRSARVSREAPVKPVAPGSGTPTGTVTFYDGTKAIGTATLVNGLAKFTISTLARGTHSITAVYNGEPRFSDQHVVHCDAVG